MLQKVLRKKNEVGWKNLLVGICKVCRLKKLQKRYHFASWHLSPYELRKYAQATAEYVNAHNPESVVDVGCGLGEILHHIKANKRIGIDLQEVNVLAANYISRLENIDFQCGSFERVGRAQTIDYLITLNFMHGSDENIWQPIYHTVCENNDIRHIIVDVIPETDSSHKLDFSKILPPEYVIEDILGPFLGERYLYIYKKKS